MNVTETICKAINDKRIEIKKSKKSLSKETGISYQGILNILNGRNTNTTSLDVIFDVLNIEITKINNK